MSSNPYAPSVDAASPEGSAFDVHVTMVTVFLFVTGGSLLVIGLMLGFMGLFMGFMVATGSLPPPHAGDPPNEFMPFIAFFEALFFAIPGSLYAIAAYGLGTRKKWGWIGALIGCALTMTGCCAPFGLYGFYALLREPQRRLYGFA